MNKNNSFNNLNSVLNTVMVDLGLDKGLKQQEFAKLWPKIVGPKFQNSSRVVYLQSRQGEDILTVAVSSSAVAQELSFFKEDIMKKIRIVAKDFHYNIKEILFNSKLWEELKKEKNQKTEEESKNFYKIEKNFSEEDLKRIELSEEVVDEIKKSMEGQKFYSEELKEKLFNTIIKDLKTQEWRKNNGFPVCLKCGIAINYYSPDNDNLCPACKYKEK